MYINLLAERTLFLSLLFLHSLLFFRRLLFSCCFDKMFLFTGTVLWFCGKELYIFRISLIKFEEIWRKGQINKNTIKNFIALKDQSFFEFFFLQVYSALNFGISFSFKSFHKRKFSLSKLHWTLPLNFFIQYKFLMWILCRYFIFIIYLPKNSKSIMFLFKMLISLAKCKVHKGQIKCQGKL